MQKFTYTMHYSPMKLNLPFQLEFLRKNIEATITPYVEIHTQRNEYSEPWKSNFFGSPYMPKGYMYPVDIKGSPMIMVAQINFSEVSQLQNYPQKGILQFFVGSDELLGFNDKYFENKNFRTCWYPEVIESNIQSIDVHKILSDSEYFCGAKTCTLSFKSSESPIEISDYRFDEMFGEYMNLFDEESNKLYEVYEDAFPSFGHRIGGYASFAQEDIRSDDILKNGKYVLLLQIDSDETKNGTNFVWGEDGVANFFIEENDLINKDFSKVVYTWDSY